MPNSFRDCLYRIATLTAKLDDAEERLQRMWSVCTKMSTSFGQVGSSGGGGDAKDGPLALFADLVNKRDRYRKELDESKQKLDALLRQLPDRDQKLLRMRYGELRSWNEVHEGLAKDGYVCSGLRTMFNWHHAAFERAEKLWEVTHD